MNTSKILIILAHAFVGWALCAATMGVGMAVTTMDNTLIAHAILAPIFFAAVSLVYFRKFNFTTPLQTAVIFITFVVAMDLFVVAILINKSFEMFASFLGTWLPFSLIFTSTYLTGVLTTRSGQRGTILMTTKHILILGGYGSTGLPIAQYLLSQTDVSITLAGRNCEKADCAAAKLNTEHRGNRVIGAQADASDSQSLRKAFEGVDMVVVASSTADYAETVAKSALEAGADYFDVQYSTTKMRILQSLSSEIKDAGLCFITDGGFHPGLPAAMVRFAAEHFDILEAANVGSVIKIDWNSLDLSPATMEEFIGEFMNFQTLHFKDGRWQDVTALAMMIPRFMDFGGEFGRQYCIPMFLEEMRSLPAEHPSLHETGFFVGGFNWFVDWFLSPVIMVGLKLFPKSGLRPLGRLMFWGLKTFSQPPYGTLLKLEAKGTKDNKPKLVDMLISHADGYALTAIPVVACLMQYLDADRKPGLWLQAHFAEPKQFFKDMESMGVEVQTQLIAGED